MCRAQKLSDVHYWEEPIYKKLETAELHVETDDCGVRVLTPHLPEGSDRPLAIRLQRSLLDEYLKKERIQKFISWYYTPMALEFSSHLQPECNTS